MTSDDAITTPVRLSVNLSPEVATILRDLAKRRGVTISEYVRDAIATERFLDDESRKGCEILLRDPKGSIREVVFR